ncbi:MAG: hypothetical protein JSS79_15765 [Bacteroidetes bacterium]|nr:hypothetical protein [Bacteroidota bacterium]
MYHRVWFKRYVLPLLAALIVTLVYSAIPIRLFHLDIAKRVRLAVFRLADSPRPDESIVLLNIGILNPDELKVKLDSILSCHPQKVGVNLCHFKVDVNDYADYYKRHKEVVIAQCEAGEPRSLSRIIEADNSVNHFRTDRDDYFEFKIYPFYSRGNESEIIVYTDPARKFYHYDLADIAILPEYFQGRTILLGYFGDYLADSSYYHYQTDRRVTPMNFSLQTEEVSPDMFDTDISAIIINQIKEKKFISKITLVPAVCIIMAFCMINILLLNLLKTKRKVLNVLIAAIIFILLSLASSALVLYLFLKNYYLNIDEVMVVILITTIFTIGLNIVEDKRLAGPEQSTN